MRTPRDGAAFQGTARTTVPDRFATCTVRDDAVSACKHPVSLGRDDQRRDRDDREGGARDASTQIFAESTRAE